MPAVTKARFLTFPLLPRALFRILHLNEKSNKSGQALKRATAAREQTEKLAAELWGCDAAFPFGVIARALKNISCRDYLKPLE